MPVIVIVGAGVAGIAVAQALEKHKPALPSGTKVILLDKREFYYHIIAGLRAPVDAQLAEQCTIPYDRVFKAGSPAMIVRAEATRIDDHCVYTDAQGEHAQIAYDYLVMATGSTWSQELNLPNARADAMHKLETQGAEIAAAKKIIIVGGGAVGTELAGEIAEKYSGQKQKHITLVHRGQGLLNDVYPDKLRKSLKTQLENRGVDVRLGVSIASNTKAGQVSLSDGEQLSCDLIYETVGGKPNTDLISALDATVVSSNGIKVDSTFQVVGHPKIFALGDVADLKEQKQAVKIREHAPVVATNLVSLLKEKKTVKEYAGQKEVIIVTVGKTGGAGWLFGWNIGSFLSSNFKSKGLFLSQTRKTLGY